jgi:hypothetical protein
VSAERIDTVTVLSFGGGQDSTAILYRLLEDPAARAEFAPGFLLVVMGDTEDEHDDTVAHVERIREYVASRPASDRVEFRMAGREWRVPSWSRLDGGLRGFMRATSTIFIKAQRKTCTDQLKLTPIYNLVDHWLAERFGLADRHGIALTDRRGRGKLAIRQYVGSRGRLRMLIGIARGEEKRVAKPVVGMPPWRRELIEMSYPLLVWGWDRGDCQRAIAAGGHEVPPPSNCRLCPYMDGIELLALSRRDPESLAEWQRFEAAKLAKSADECARTGRRNLAVWGAQTLGQALARAEAKHGHMTDAQLAAHRMNHGHCVESRY